MQSTNTINSISVLHKTLGCKKPDHPLITFISFHDINRFNVDMTIDFYAIAFIKSVHDEPDTFKSVYLYKPGMSIDMIDFKEKTGEILFITQEFVELNGG